MITDLLKELAYHSPEDGLSCHLNHSSLTELDDNLHLLNGGQQYLLRVVTNKIEELPRRFKRRGDPDTGKHNQHYGEMAGLILMSAWDDRFRYSNCGVKRLVQGSYRRFNCANYWFCPACCHRRRMEFQRRFAHSFNSGRFFHLTVSYGRSLSLVDPPGQFIEVYWDAIVSALRLMVEAGFIRGVYWAQEMFLESLDDHVPVLPHLHAIIDADAFGDLEQQVLHLLISEYRGESWSNDKQKFLPDDDVRVRLPISIDVVPIETEHQFHNTVGYLCKPVDLATAYLAGVQQCQLGERDFCQLNQAKDDFLLGVHILFGPVRSSRQSDRLPGRVRFGARGTLDGRSRSKFIGMERRVRETKAHQRLTKLVLLEAKFNAQFEGDPFEETEEQDAPDPDSPCSGSGGDLTPSPDQTSSSNQPSQT